MKEMIDDLNYAIVTEGLLSDDANIEILEQAIENWQGLLDSIRREKEDNRRYANRHEFSDVLMAEFGLRI